MVAGPAFGGADGPTVDTSGKAVVAQTESNTAQARMSEIDLRNLVEMPPAGFLSEVEDGRIYSGEKNFFIDPAADPILANNNFRDLLSRKTGAVLLEEEIQGVHFNVGFRGLTPNNAISLQVVQDGFPIECGRFWRAFCFFCPRPQSNDAVQFANSGFGVLGGPQVGGLVNFISYPIAGRSALWIRNTATEDRF